MSHRAAQRKYHVYMMTNKSHTLYVEMTNDLVRRVWEHKNKLIDGFTSRYHINRLIYFEETDNPRAAVERERRIKGWRRSKKVELIESMNPEWRDLSADWYADDSDAAKTSVSF